MNVAAKSTEKADNSHHSSSRSRAPANVSHPTFLPDNGLGLSGLHQNVGNLAIQRMFHAGRIQAKLTVSQPNDPAEHEAERVADQIVQAPNASLQPKYETKCAECSAGGPTCPKCLQAQWDGRRGAAPSATATDSSLGGSLSGGQPLS